MSRLRNTCKILRTTLERYHPHANEPYDRSRQLIREQNTAHHNKVKGKAFKLNNHPADYFDHNPFKRVNINKPAEAEGQKVKLKAWFTLSHLTQLGRSNLECPKAGINLEYLLNPDKDYSISNNFSFK